MRWVILVLVIFFSSAGYADDRTVVTVTEIKVLSVVSKSGRALAMDVKTKVVDKDAGLIEHYDKVFTDADFPVDVRDKVFDFIKYLEGAQPQ